jgi:two-component system cell cycle sensor histidine kinase/response regulator CckA
MDSEGRPAGASARKDLELYLQRHEKLLPALLDSAAQAILGVDPHGYIVLANAQTERTFGYSRRELVGASIDVLVPVASQAVHAGHRTEYFANPRIRPMGIGMELAGRRKDGKEFPAEVSLSYLDTDEGRFAIAFVTDITPRKQLQEQLLHAQKLEAVGRLAGGVAHDFNNLLTVILGYERMLLEELPPDSPLRDYAAEVLKAGERAGTLVSQLLAFSRRQVMQPRVLDVNLLLLDAEKMLRRLIGEDIQLSVLLSPEAGNIRVDPGHIEQIVFNLAVNARDAMPDGGRLTIETAPARLDEAYARTHAGVTPGDYVMLGISDTGQGMDAETKSHMFEPFFTTKGQGKGTGLGLATVYGIVKQSGGDIWVYSEPGQGTTFKVYFPRADGPADRPAGSPSAAVRGTETVLVVEDEEGVRELIAALLRRLGYTVIAAVDGHDAIRLSERHAGPIQLLLTDVVLPQAGGRQVAEKLRLARPGMRVLYLSGYTENAVVHHGVLDADVAFLAKPFSHEALAKKVREVLDYGPRG